MALAFRPRTSFRRFLAYYAAFLVCGLVVGAILRPSLGEGLAVLGAYLAFGLVFLLLDRAERASYRTAHEEFMADHRERMGARKGGGGGHTPAT